MKKEMKKNLGLVLGGIVVLALLLGAVSLSKETSAASNAWGFNPTPVEFAASNAWG